MPSSKQQRTPAATRAGARRPASRAPQVRTLGARVLRERLADGALDSATLVGQCLERIAEREEAVGAWAWLDAEHALEQARARDLQRRTGRPIGALHGLPVALKDIIDTDNVPTENGTPLDAGRVPSESAWIVRRLEAEGAVVLGKTVSTELAFLQPARTRNPVNGAHTPGGSSSGSAAAVADGMVPLAIGTQTGGSVIRPAAFCGTVGFKPTFGAVPRSGILSQSPSLDTVGVFAADVEGAALLAEVLFGHDEADRATVPRPFPRLLDIARQPPPVEPTFAFVRTPWWERADADTRAAFAELVGVLGERCFESGLPDRFVEAASVRERINLAEMSRHYHHYGERDGSGAGAGGGAGDAGCGGAEAGEGERAGLSALMRETLARGRQISAHDYLAALDWPIVLNAGLDALFERCDAVLTPAAPGAAPEGLGSTGDAIFNGLWTLCGTPAITLPLFESSTGLPMGVQLVGRRGDDARLLRTARWLVEHLEKSA